MANTGLPREATSAEYTARSEQSIQQNPDNNTKQVQTLSSNRQVHEREESEDDGKKKQNSDKEDDDEAAEQDESSDSEEDSDSEAVNDFNIDDLENPNKDFYVKLNAKDDIIELYESSTSRLIETISGNELQGLVKKLNMASGIFVNKRV